ncbi:MAG: NHLP family bacteriocin export ABC transporter peptidase/permease/ATPase subunit [Syntrophomonas sp.]
MKNTSARQKQKLYKNRFKKRVKTPTVIQMEATECGAASLAIILGYYGKYVPLEELRIACGVSRDGSKAGNIVKAARTYGLVVRACRYEPEELKSITLPAIIHWNFNHFLVLEGFGRGGVYLNDPAGGPYKVSEEEFDLSYTGVTLLFNPSAEFSRSGARRTLVSNLRLSLQGLSSPLTYLTLVSFLLIFPGIVLPALVKVFIDTILAQKQGTWVLALFLGLVLTALFRAGVTWLREKYLINLENSLALSFSKGFVRHILNLPLEFFLQRYAGDIATRVTYNDAVSEMITGKLASTVMDLAMALFFFVLMFLYDPLLAILGTAVALVNFAVLILLSQRRVNQQRKLLVDSGKLYGTSASGLEIIETIKANGTESDFFARWAGYQAKLINAEQGLGLTQQLLLTIPVLINSLNTVVILAVGSWQVMTGRITLGTLVAFQTLLQSFITPINNLVAFSDELQDLNIYLERLHDVYDYPAKPALTDIEEEDSGDQKLAGAVELKHITFGYSKLEPPLVEDLNLRLAPGQHVALVGGSGSGKSTVAKIVADLYQPWSGEVLFDGKPRGAIPVGVFRRSFAMVDQEISIFEGTVRENITLWNEQIADEAVSAAARDAYVYDIIVERESGFGLLLDENGRCFSGGEKQRMEIARALVLSPAILILDEATSALDPVIEKMIIENIRRRGCSCLIVAHRLSTIMDCDEIIVLDKGNVVERGTHAELLARDGSYAQLVKSNG